MKGMTLKRILKATGGEFYGGAELLEREITQIITDSRKITEACLFAAMRGNRSDGHDFMASACVSGALCCLAERRGEPDTPAIIVPSTLAALGKIAGEYRSGFDIPVVGITGSVGKTGTKEMTASVLSQTLNTLRTEGNFNNELGVPLTLFRLDDAHEAAVVEMGISEPGEMRRLANMVKPDLAVFTAIGDSHLEKLQDRRGVLKAKAEIIEGMPSGGAVFINGDDELLRGFDFGRKRISFGTGEGCDLRAVNLRPDGTRATELEVVSGSSRFSLKIPAYGRHLVYAALAAAAVGLWLGQSGDEISRGVGAYKTVGHRARPLDTGYLTVIDDCYNSNPSSARMALDSLCSLPGRQVAILGDMLELGPEEAALHEALGRYAAESGAGLIIACGALSEKIFGGARDGGAAAIYFETKEKLKERLPGLVRAGDKVLVKASRGMRFEEIVEALEKLS